MEQMERPDDAHQPDEQDSDEAEDGEDDSMN